MLDFARTFNAESALPGNVLAIKARGHRSIQKKNKTKIKNPKRCDDGVGRNDRILVTALVWASRR